MVNIKYSELLGEVLPYLNADPSDPVAENVIKRTVIEFCARSWVWQHLTDQIDVVAGENTYDLEQPTGTDVVAVISAALDAKPLLPKDILWLNKEMPCWQTTGTQPQYFTQVDTEQIILAGMPNSGYSLTLTLALQPSRSATSFPKWILNQYLYVLADGALSKLMMMPNKPWTDINNGADRRAKFESGIFNARASSVSALGRAPQRVTSQH